MEQAMRENNFSIRQACEASLAEKIEHLAKENRELHDREDVRLVMDAKKPLQLDDYQVEEMREQLKQYLYLLKKLFDHDRRSEKIDLRKFLETSAGRHWESPGTMLLLVYGRNEKSSSTHHCWLSPVAIDLAQGLLESNQPIAVEACRDSSGFELTLARLIFQLLERNPGLIRQAQSFRDVMSLISRPPEGDGRISELRAALLRVINLHDSRVCLIVDRPELCSISCARFITIMLSLVKEATTELKIMLVVRSEIWDFEARADEIDTREIDQQRFRRERMDQTKARR
ncbi:MAG: hypothetical protein M1822_008525 [Bathelium mastoideum]|nr:MAG: hypothetical protein M1822_008525 [Bathelium mastoideum]